MIELATVTLPEFGAESVCPEIPVQLYELRLRAGLPAHGAGGAGFPDGLWRP